MTMALKNDSDERPDFEGRPCTNLDPELFFPEDGVTVPLVAQFACATCPIRPECLNYATQNRMDGYWGGTTRYEREALTRRYERVKCPGCASHDVLEDDHSGVCAACGLSWPV